MRHINLHLSLQSRHLFPEHSCCTEWCLMHNTGAISILASVGSHSWSLIDPGHPQAHANDAILLHPGSCQGSWAVAHGVLNPCRTRAMQSRTSVATPYSAICMKEYSRGACTCDGSLQGAQSSILANAVPTGRSTVFLKPQSSHCARAAIAVPALPVGSSSCRAAQELLCLSIQDDTVRF